MAEGGSEAGGDRSLPATEARRRRAREEGQVPLSREIVSTASLGAAALALVYLAPGLIHRLNGRLTVMVFDLSASPAAVLQQAGVTLLITISPILILTVMAGAFAVMLQTGFLVRPLSTIIEFSRLNPRRGLLKIFGPDAAVETLKSLLKALVLIWAAWQALINALPKLINGMELEAWGAVQTLTQLVTHLLMAVLSAQILIALLDVLWVRYRFSSRLRMSLQEIKQESRDAEGDPIYRSRLKQIRLARARKRMMSAIPKATVIVTNPTHYAVALAYDRGGKGAPRVVAKGVDEVAARIRAVAKQHGIPTVANPPLARALYPMPLDAEISAEHFKAVAEIIAYVWRLRDKVAAVPRPTP